ncbi:LamG-like jellyroll fold domain-containing protein [Anaerovorax odorimutans]|uniref:LamG-like jellyroll fold domain-containing protein n=1 Tax=Anaerovorax odorimutans TaxID=109327 RepID=UPI000412ACAC|nr:LamG-like jellyroll fold domain-containing protein [Anaerovorax odorimutans]
MNHYAYYALKAESGDYASTKAIAGCSFCGGTKLTFSFDVYWDKGMHGILFKQENSAVCQISDETLSWKAGTILLANDPLSSPLILGGWNHIDIAYEDKQVCLYLNAIQVDKIELKSSPVYSESPYEFLTGYNGYLRNVRLADYALTQAEICNNLFKNVINKEHLLLYIPFDKQEVKDEGKFEQTVICKGQCCCITLIKALQFRQGGVAYLEDVSVNPGCENVPKFTIAIRIFAEPVGEDNTILFQNKGTEDSLEVHLKEKQTKLSVKIKDEEILFSNTAIPYYEWTTIFITVEETNIKCYINGVKSDEKVLKEKYERTSASRIILGSQDDENIHGFIGAVDYIGLYKKVLSDEEILDAYKVEPYVFDNDIAMLFLCHGEEFKNYIGSGSLLLGKNASLEILEGTVYESEIPELQVRTNNKFSGNDFEKWQADFLSDVCCQYMSASSGFTFSEDNNGCVKQYLLDSIGDSAAAQELIIDFSIFTAIEIINFIKIIGLKKLLLDVMIKTMLKGATASVIAANIEKIIEFQIGLGIAAAAVFVADVAVKAKSKTKKPDNPPWQPPDPDPKRGYSVEVKNIQFCNGDKGSIPLRIDYNNKQTLPEWTNALSTESVCAYISKNQQPKIKVTFSYIPAKDQEPVNLSIGAKGTLLGDFISSPVLCSVKKDYEAEIILSSNKLNTADGGKHTENLRWYCKSSVKENFLRVTNNKIHIICNTPTGVWSLTNEKEYPMIPLLNIFASVAESYKDPIKTADQAICACGNWLSTQKKYHLDKDNKYSRLEMHGLEFCAEKFYDTLSSNSLTAGSLDFSVFTANLLAMEGFNVSIYEIHGMEKVKRGSDKKLISYSTGLKMNSVTAFNVSFDEIMKRHYVLVISDNKQKWLYDVVLKSKKDSVPWFKLSWNDYRNKAILYTSYVESPFIINAWKEIDELPVSQSNSELSITYDPKEKIFSKSERLSFKDSIKNKYSFPKNEACCHRISYIVLEDILIQTFNSLKNGTIEKEVKDDIINYFATLFYNDTEPDQETEPDKYQNYVEMKEYIGELLEVDKSSFKNKEINTDIGEFLDNLLCCLNSSDYNLRKGYASWNSSIGDNYDPEAWKFIKENDGKFYCVFDQNGKVNEENPREEYTEEGVYIINEVDNRSIGFLRDLEAYLNCDFFGFSYGSYVPPGSEDEIYPILYSSNNEFLLKDTVDRIIEGISYFCYNYVTNSWDNVFIS